jgi:nucleotide-binding universal stress UspA family protein
MKSILVPVDFSFCSKNALKIAIQIAKKWDSKVKIIHTTYVPTPYVNMGEAIVEPVASGYRDEIDRAFKSLEIDIPGLKEINYETHEFSTTLIDAIAGISQSGEIQLIVMGTKGAHDAIERLLGSHTSEIIQTSSIPVLMIPEDVSEWDIKKIGLASDEKSISDVQGLSLLKELATLNRSEIEVFFVSKSGEGIAIEDSPQCNTLRNKFPQLKMSCYNVSEKHVSSGIVKFATEHHLDLVVMIPRKHNLFNLLIHGSITKDVSMKIRTPLLALPE